MFFYDAMPCYSDDDDDMPMSPESFDDEQGSPAYFSSNLDDVTAQLAAAGGWQGEMIPCRWLHNYTHEVCGHDVKQGQCGGYCSSSWLLVYSGGN